ncbi:hypothetical protein CK203_038497 [Vitis vinifera]|uniref:Uncharacterized protein n=1 Tax=Vitis vinifera TaxID=29760 RepID=A0A438IRY0_VITVI|nr:hypothetical protein CK203_038497 [Vitis vinifera]
MALGEKELWHVVPLPSTTESLLPPTPTFDTSLPVLRIPLPPPLLSVPELAVPISTPAVLVSNISRLHSLRSSMLPRMGDFVTLVDTRLEVDGGTEILQDRLMVRSSFVLLTLGMDIIIKDDPPMVQDANEVVTPIVEIIDQATIPMLERYMKLSILSLALDFHFYIYLI